MFIALSFSPFPFADRINFLKNYDSFNEAKPSSADRKRFAIDCCRPLLLKRFYPESIEVSCRISDSWENLRRYEIQRARLESMEDVRLRWGRSIHLNLGPIMLTLQILDCISSSFINPVCILFRHNLLYLIRSYGASKQQSCLRARRGSHQIH